MSSKSIKGEWRQVEERSYIKKLVTALNEGKADDIIFCVYNGESITYISSQQFKNDILRTVGYFKQKNIVAQHIAIAAENSYDWIVVFWGIVCSGNTAVFINQDLPADVLQDQCFQADVSMICSSNTYASQIKLFLDNIECVEFSEIKSGAKISEDEIYDLNPEETLVMMFTSGTTGKSKIAEFSFNNIYSYIEDTLVLPFPEIDRVLLCLPLFHIYGLLFVLAWMKRGKTIAIGRGMRYLLSDIPVLNPGHVALVPAAMDSIVKLLKNAGSKEERQKYIGKKLCSISVGGAGANLGLCRELMSFGIEIQSAYGMTESAGTGTWCIWDEDNFGSIGKPFGKAKCRIEDGELLLSSPSIMKGYYKDPQETARIIVDGWLHTGDLAYCDNKGYYYLTGRKKNIIVLSNGENINPEEIEAKMCECMHILECLVYDDGKGICADIYTESPNKAAEYIKKYNDGVPMYRRIHKVNYFSSPLVKTGSGKIKRKEI